MTKTKVTLNSNGSLKVDRDFEIVNAQYNVFGLPGIIALSLTRCGHLVNKPFINRFRQDYYSFEAPRDLNAGSVDISLQEKRKTEIDYGF